MKLFSTYDLRKRFEEIKLKVTTQINALKDDYVVINDLDIIAFNIYEEHYIIPIALKDNEKEFLPPKSDKLYRRERRYDRINEYYVDGIRFYLTIPFTGDKTLFESYGSSFSLTPYPSVELSSDNLTIEMEKELSELKNLIAEDINSLVLKHFDRDIIRIKEGIASINNEVSIFNDSLRTFIKQKLSIRLDKANELYRIMGALSIPLEKVSCANKEISIKRRILPTNSNSSVPQNTSYVIDEDDYISILDAIYSFCSGYEKTPDTYHNMEEEDFRNTIVHSLTTIFKRQVTGETFRVKGKTDICIEAENMAAFVAECKIWKGAKGINDALLQLDGYLTWRDCKTALIYFVKNLKFKEVFKSARKELESSELIHKCKEIFPNKFECELRSNNNPGQLIKVCVMLFKV